MKKPGRGLRGLALSGFAALVLPLAAALPEGYDTVWLSPHANPAVRASAEDLATLLERSYGERPVIRRTGLASTRTGLHIGPALGHPAFDGDPLTDEVLVARTGRGLEIAGPDNAATCFAVYRFLEAFLGWRYFQPGALGLERLDRPPRPPSVKGEPGILLYEQAGFLSRHPDIGRTGDPDWSVWHGERERFVYNHTLHRVIPPSLFEEHPDWFAKDAAGVPMRPPYPQPHGYNDHPDLSVEAVQERVVQQTIEALETSLAEGDSARTNPPVKWTPGTVSTSLSLGDSYIFGHYPEGGNWGSTGWFRRWPDWSNHVFRYTNRIAHQIAGYWEQRPWPYGEKPDLYLGALAYLVWENVPDFPVHPSVIPYLTYDRSQWYSPEARAEDRANLENWARAGPELIGTWDYLFGYGFLIPRSMVKIIKQAIPELRARGIDAYFSQVAPIWPFDAHTTWLTTRLLWNPEAGADALMAEFNDEFYGPAAVPMAAFFNLAESIWMGQGGHPWWLRHWKNPWQAALWSPAEIRQARSLLESALAEAAQYEDPGERDGLAPGRFLSRVQETADVFSLTEAFHLYQTLGWQLQRPTEGDPEDRLLLARDALLARERLAAGTRRVVAANPNAARAGDLSWVFRYDTIGGSLAALGMEGPALGADRKPDSPADDTEVVPPAIARRLEGPAPSGPPAVPRDALDSVLTRWMQLEGHAGLPDFADPRPVLFDKDFSHVADPRIWHHQFLESEGLHTGPGPDGAGFRAENVRRGHLYQLFPAEPHHFYLGALDVATRQSPSAEVYIRVDFFDTNHQLIGGSRRARIAPTDPYGERQTVHALMQAPGNAAYGRLFIRFYELDPDQPADLHRAEVWDLGHRPAP